MVCEEIIKSGLNVNILIMVLFFFGVFIWGLSLRKLEWSQKIIGFFLLLTFFIPFALYWMLGILGISFGNERNFFYLLPVYLLFAFFGLKKIFIKKWAYRSVSSLILVVMLIISFGGIQKWREINETRELVRVSANHDSELTLLFFNSYGIHRKPAEYYAGKFRLKNMFITVPLSSDPALFDNINLRINSIDSLVFASYLPYGKTVERFLKSKFLDSFQQERMELEYVEVAPFSFYGTVCDDNVKKIAIVYMKRKIGN